MERQELELEFKRIVGGDNFMTPVIIDYFERGSYIIELSTGHGKFCDLYCYGVTIADTKTREHLVDLSKNFSSSSKDIALKNAMDYIASFS